MFNRISSSSSLSWINSGTSISAATDTAPDQSTAVASERTGKRKWSDALPPARGRSVSQRSESSHHYVSQNIRPPGPGPALSQGSGPGCLARTSNHAPAIATAWSATDLDRALAAGAAGYRGSGVVTSGRAYDSATSVRAAALRRPTNDDYSLNLPDDVRADISNADVTGVLNLCRHAVRAGPGFARAVFTHAAGQLPRLNASGAEIAELFDYLRTAIANIHPASMRLAPMIALASQLADPRCVTRCVPFGQERAFLALQVDIERVTDVQCRDFLKARWTAGIWMANDPGLRGLLWTTMWEQRDNSTRRVELIEALSHSLKYLPQDRQMEAAYTALVEITPSLPAASQGIVLGNLVNVLASSHNPAFRDVEFRALQALATRLPEALRSTVRNALRDLSPGLPPAQSRAPFAAGTQRVARAANAMPQAVADYRPSPLNAGPRPVQSEAPAIAMAQALGRLPTPEALVQALLGIRRRGKPQWDMYHPEMLLVMTKLIPLMFKAGKMPESLSTIVKSAQNHGPQALARVVEAIENEMVSIAVGLGSEIQCERESPTLASRFEHLLASAARIPGEPGGRWVAAVSDILDSAAQRQSRSLTQMIGSCADHLPLAVWPDRVIEHALIS